MLGNKNVVKLEDSLPPKKTATTLTITLPDMSSLQKKRQIHHTPYIYKKCVRGKHRVKPPILKPRAQSDR